MIDKTKKQLNKRKDDIWLTARNIAAIFLIASAIQILEIYDLTNFLDFTIFFLVTSTISAAAIAVNRPKTRLKSGYLLISVIIITSIIDFLGLNSGVQFINLQLASLYFALITGLIIISKTNIAEHAKKELSIPKTREDISNNVNENKIYYSLILAIIALGFVLRLYKMGVQDFRGDEFQVISSAYGYLETGRFQTWDFIQNQPDQIYDRAWPHTLMIAASFAVLGFTEFAARVPSLIFGVLLMAAYYYVLTRFTESKYLSLAFLFSMALNPHLISLSRYARMYAIFIPSALIFTYLVYKGLTNPRRITWVDEKLGSYQKYREKYFDFDLRYLAPAAILLIFTYLVHRTALVLGPGIAAFVFYAYLVKKKKKYLAAFWTITAGATAIIALEFAGVPIIGTHFITVLEKPHYSYIDLLFRYTIIPAIGIPLIIANFYNYFREEILTYLTSIITLGTIFFIYFANRYVSAVYISQLAILTALLIPITLDRMSQLLERQKIFNLVTAILVITLSITSFTAQAGEIYGENDNFGEFSKAYETINQNIQEDDVLMGQYLREPYIRTKKDIQFVNLLNNQKYPYQNFTRVVENNDRVWVTWETRKGYHLQPEIKNYVDENFEKLHGEGVDNTNVEVYAKNY